VRDLNTQAAVAYQPVVKALLSQKKLPAGSRARDLYGGMHLRGERTSTVEDVARL
jgi:hypothetical protein